MIGASGAFKLEIRLVAEFIDPRATQGTSRTYTVMSDMWNTICPRLLPPRSCPRLPMSKSRKKRPMSVSPLFSMQFKDPEEGEYVSCPEAQESSTDGSILPVFSTILYSI